MIAALFRRGPLDVPIQAVVGDVQLAAEEPLRVGKLPLDGLPPRLEPPELLGLALPEPDGIPARLAVDRGGSSPAPPSRRSSAAGTSAPPSGGPRWARCLSWLSAWRSSRRREVGTPGARCPGRRSRRILPDCQPLQTARPDAPHGVAERGRSRRDAQPRRNWRGEHGDPDPPRPRLRHPPSVRSDAMPPQFFDSAAEPGVPARGARIARRPSRRPLGRRPCCARGPGGLVSQPTTSTVPAGGTARGRKNRSDDRWRL